MTLHVFSQDVVPLIQLGLTALGLLSLFLVWWQVWQTNRWNKLESRQTFLSQYSSELETKLIKASKDAGVDLKARRDPLTEDEVKNLSDHPDAYDAVLSSLSDLETTCTAVNVGAVDDGVAYELHCSRVVLGRHIYRPLIAVVAGS